MYVMTSKYVMTLKHIITSKSSSWCQKYVMTSKVSQDVNNTWQNINHDAKTLIMTPKTRHAVTNFVMTTKFVMITERSSWYQKHVMTSKTRHDLKNTSWCQNICVYFVCLSMLQWVVQCTKQCFLLDSSPQKIWVCTPIYLSYVD